VTGAIVSLVAVVWTATVAAFTYLNRLATEAARIDGQVLARAAGTLVSIGKAIAKSLEWMLSYLSQVVEKLLAPVLDPMVSSIRSYVSNVGQTLNATVSDVTLGGTVSVGHAVAFADALSGSVLVFGLALAIVIQVVVGIVSLLGPAPNFVITIILSLITLGLTAALLATSGANLLSNAAIWIVDRAANSTFPSNSQSSIQVNWKALAESVSSASAVPSVALAIWVGGQLPDNQMMKATASLVLALLSAVVEFVVWASHLPILVILALVLGSVAFILATSSLLMAPVGPLKFWGAVALGFASVAEGAAVADATSVL